MTEYSSLAQPYLDAIGHAVFRDSSVRDWLISGTRVAQAWAGSTSLHDLQKQRRGSIKQPFWCNYWCGRREEGKEKCACSALAGNAKESDVVFFLQNRSGHRLAVHLEFKRKGESLGIASSRDLSTARCMLGLWNLSAPARFFLGDDGICSILMEDSLLDNKAYAFFDRRIGHSEAAEFVPGWPDGV